MTQLSASKAVPQQLDLATINEVQQVIVRALRDRVCEWEQDAFDSGKRGEYAAAQQAKAWAFAADLCASVASSACTALFLDACESQPVIRDARFVKLPAINRSPRDLALDVMAVEVASEQQEPAPF